MTGQSRPFRAILWGGLVPLCAVVLGYFIVPITLMNQGFGTDGFYYGSWAKDFIQEVFEKGLSPYQSFRLLPSAVVFFFLSLLHLNPTNENVIWGFRLMNLALLGGAGSLWMMLARRLHLSLVTTLFGLFAVCVNGFTVKWISHVPVMTDATGYFLSMLMTYAYFVQKQKLLALATFISLMSWPVGALMGGIGLLFPISSHQSEKQTSQMTAYLVTAFLLLCCGMILLLCISRSYWVVQPWGLRYSILGGVILFAYLAKGSFELCRSLPFPIPLRSRRIGIVFAVGLFGLVCLLLISKASVLTLFKMIIHILFVIVPSKIVTGAVAMPGIFLIGNALMFGPATLLILWNWKAICRRAGSSGFGMWLWGVICFLWSPHGESRALLSFYFPILPLLCLEINPVLNRSRLLYFAALSIFFLRFWTPGPLSGAELMIAGVGKRFFAEQCATVALGGYLLFKLLKLNEKTSVT